MPRKPPPQPSSPSFLPIFLIVVAALALRLWGIDWALPNASRAFSFHPDESVVTGYALALNPFAGRLDPGFYNYGSLSLLLDSIAIRLMGASTGPLPSATALLAARLISAGLGAATCLFLFGAGRLLYDRTAGWIAAGLYAIAPLAVQHAHFATVDIPATFWISGSLYFAARHLHTDERRRRDLLWAGLWAGLAAATKYNALLVVLAGAAAWWLGGTRDRKTLALLLGGALVGFVVGCPGAILNPKGLIAGVMEEAFHVRSGHGDVFKGTPIGLIFHITFNLNWGLTLPLLLVALVGVGNALVRRRPADLLLLAFALPYYLLIGVAQVKFARYTLPLFPPLFLLTGGSIAAIAQPTARRVCFGVAGVAAAIALLFSIAIDQTMTLPDTRDQAAAFIREQGFESVGFATGPWFFSPTLNPLLAAPNPAMARAAAAETEAPRLIPATNEWDIDLLRRENPRAVALSEINEYVDALRGGDPAKRAYVDAVRAGRPNVRVFGKPMQVFGWRFTNLAPVRRGEPADLPSQHLPHDMLYTNPTTVIFYR